MLTMEDIKRILVVSRMTKYCRKAVHYGVSLAKTYGAELYVLHVVYDPFTFGDWNLPMPTLDEEYRKTLKETKEELHKIITKEKEKGVRVKELIKEGKPTGEILKTVEEEDIDLIILLAHEEGHLEHFLFGRSNEAIIQKMPCSVFLVKKEPEPVAF
jgi:nucleotide-binding universal stress UspA family protein